MSIIVAILKKREVDDGGIKARAGKFRYSVIFSME